jgi:predicted N-formylglutamate amidohydrolase
MNSSNLGRIDKYARDNEEARVKMGTLVDAFQYTPVERSLLRRVMNAMIHNSRIASAMCALCIGYEAHTTELSIGDRDEFNETMKRIAKASSAALVDADYDRIRTVIMNPTLPDPILTQLSNTADIPADACNTPDYRYKQYKCDIRPVHGSASCGLNTNLGCQKGSQIGTEYCEAVPGSNRCRLTPLGKSSGERKEMKRRIDDRFRSARTDYLNR